MMAFMYGGLVPKGVRNVNNVRANFGRGGDPFNPEEDQCNKLY